ncbi:hypothetical protein G6N82_07505 [Altererythrobacter sp. BO-6]|uniref:hypothetical protein n=1 Tax=Altererythrobacter sp. BO-6 TaxID=2604537 RepID=UPI0013E14740|nr:hypothetical protein [Altererythrobacter sp. BO-6]QIG54018.1 hypothetical protein G6N82_07505 [Altererythrobacter sp. BO-6]
MDALNPTLIGIIGTLLALAVSANGWRLARGAGGNRGAVLGRLHIWLGVLFIPLVWFIILVLIPGNLGVAA